jgi:hypothetical protein
MSGQKSFQDRICEYCFSSFCFTLFEGGAHVTTFFILLYLSTIEQKYKKKGKLEIKR